MVIATVADHLAVGVYVGGWLLEWKGHKLDKYNNFCLYDFTAVKLINYTIYYEGNITDLPVLKASSK